MLVSRSFDVNRPGTPIKSLGGGVLGGSLSQGTIKKGEKLLARPGVETQKKGMKEMVFTAETLRCEGGPLEAANPGGLIAIGSTLDPNITKSDSMVGCLVGRPDSLPETKPELSFEHHLLSREEFDNPPLKIGEPVVINVNTATGIGAVAASKKGKVLVKLKKPMCVASGSTVAVSRRVGQRWRLSGWGRTI
jgi:translation initiation factor 2 subunit 3